MRPQSGSPQLGGGVTFSIPQFGDFFHDMVCRTRISNFNAQAIMTPQQSVGTTTVPAIFPANGENADGTTTADAQGYLGSQKFYNLVDACGNRLVSGVAAVDGDGQPSITPHAAVPYRNLVRYCEWPGNRLFQDVKFDVNGNPLDEYDDLVPVFLTKFCLPPNKVTGFKRLVGQEVPLEGYGPLHCCPVTDLDAANTGNTINLALQGHGFAQFNNPPPGDVVAPADYLSDPAWPGGPVAPFGAFNSSSGVVPFAPLNSVPVPVIDFARDLKAIVDGPQTPKPAQPPLEIWNKLRFWFNDDVRLAIASVSIPFGQRFITIELATADLLAFEFPNLYLETINDIPATATTAVVAGTSIITTPLTPSQRIKSYTPIFQLGGFAAGATPTVERMELYVNNIFVNPEVHDIFIKRIGFSLIRVYRQQQTRIATGGAGELLMSQLKWPVEYMFVGMRPAWNIKNVTTGSGGIVTGGNPQVWRDWHRMTKMVDVDCDEHVKAEIASSSFMALPAITAASTAAVGPVNFTVGAAAANAIIPATGFGFNTTSNAIAGAASSIGDVTHDTYAIPVPTVDSLTVTAHGITIFDDFKDIFYNSYMPFHYGGPALVTPEDQGALFINFALFPRAYQPSGHLNISRARETYLRWTTSYISPATPADLLVVAIAKLTSYGYVGAKSTGKCVHAVLSVRVLNVQHYQIAGTP